MNKLPEVKIADNITERKAAINFYAVMLNENIKWEEHIRTVATKLATNICLP